MVCYNNPIDPLGVMLLFSNINYDFDILFLNSATDKRLLEVNYNKYNIVGFSTTTGFHLEHNKIAQFFKQKTNNKITTIMGGPHATFFPIETLSLDSIDYISVGESFKSLDDFINNKTTNNIFKKGDIFVNRLDPLVDINKLKAPNRSIVYSKSGRGNNKIRNFMGTLGCVYDCSYCFNCSFAKLYKHQPRLRFRNPELFVEEMEQCAREYPTDLLYIQDDTFILKLEWFSEVVKKIKKQVNLPYHCHIRCDLVTEDIIKLLKETGCYSVTFAVESADEQYRETFLNRRMSNEKILYVCDLLYKYNIKFRIENMIGLPHGSLQMDLDTMKFNAKCKPTVGWASLYQPYPNTKLGQLCLKDKIWDGNIDSINPTFFDESPLTIPNKMEIENLQKLFPLMVNYTLLRLLGKILIKLKFSCFYTWLYKIVKRFQYKKLYNICAS